MTTRTVLTAVYPGTFDPMTLGHEDLMRRAAGLFERLILAVAAGHHKRTMSRSASGWTSHARSPRRTPTSRSSPSVACCAISSSPTAPRWWCAACAP